MQRSHITTTVTTGILSDAYQSLQWVFPRMLTSGIGGRENLLPPGNTLGFNRLSRLLAAMTCVECGVAYGQVDRAAICEGYKLAFPENVEELEEMLCEEDEYWGW